MTFLDTLGLLGGTALFLYGMSVLGGGLRTLADARLQAILRRLSATPVRGFLLGTGVTAVIQSSAATTVTVENFVDTGMLRLPQALPVVLGSTVGTTMTGWLLTLAQAPHGGWARYVSAASLMPVAAIAGVALLFSAKKTPRTAGEILIGFALLLFGMRTISDAAAPLQADPRFLSLLTLLNHPPLGLLAGTLLAGIVQSASAGVGILQAFAGTGRLSGHMCVALLPGINLGASVPVLLSMPSVGRDGRRIALAYLLFELCSMGIVGALYYPLRQAGLLRFMDDAVTSAGLALLNTLLRLVCAAVLLPCTGHIERLTDRLLYRKNQKEGLT